jgi:hypothetical protein
VREACAAAADLRAVQDPFEHAVQVVVAFGELPAGDGTSGGVAEQEHAEFDVVAFAQGVGEPQRAVSPLAAVGLIVDDNEDVYRGIVARSVPAGLGTDCGSPGEGPRTSLVRAVGMSTSTQSPEAAVSAAMIAIAPP